MTKSLYGVAAAVAGIALLMGSTFAQDAKKEGTPVTITGKNYSLIKELGAGAEASATYGKLNALKVKEAKGADGKAIADLAGKTLFYLPTKAADALIAGDENAGKDVTVTGKLHAGAGVVAVEKFEAAAADEFEDLPVGGISGKPVI